MAADKKSDPVTPLEGTTKIDEQMFFEPERLSYESASAIANDIALEVVDAIKDRVVVIAGTQLLADLSNLQAVYLRLDSLQKEYDALSQLAERLFTKRISVSETSIETVNLQPDTGLLHIPVTAAIAPIGAALQATIGLVSLLREDVEYHGTRTSVDTLAFEIVLASRLKINKAATVLIPDLMVIQSANTEENSLSGRLNKVQAARINTWQIVGPLVAELVRLEAELDRAAKEKDQVQVNALTAQISELRRDLQPVSDPLSLADRSLEGLQREWNEFDESKVSILARLLRAEVIRAKKPLFLHAKVVSCGGHHRISRNLFRMIFLGDGLSFAGGATARWAQLGDDGEIERGGVFTERRRWSSLFNNQTS